MNKPKKASAETTPRRRPPHGGSFRRDKTTGALECVETTKPAGESDEEASVAEPGSGQADSSGENAGAGSGSTSEGQEGLNNA